MSMFFVARASKYAVVLSDSMALEEFDPGNFVPVKRSKIFKVCRNVYAVAIGEWQIYTQALDSFSRVISGRAQSVSSQDLVNAFAVEVVRSYGDFLIKTGRDPKERTLDVRVCLILSGPLASDEDRNEGFNTSCYLFETARSFEPTRVSGVAYAYNDTLSRLALRIFEDPSIVSLREKGPFAMAQILDAIHAFISKLSIYISVDSSIVIIGEDGHTVVKGTLITLPANYLSRLSVPGPTSTAT